MMILKLIRESFLFAFQAVILNRLRTFLSLFGITIGIFAIISVFTILDWMENSIRENIASLGDKTIYIAKWPWSFDPNLAWWEMVKRPVPTIREYEELKVRLRHAEALAFVVQSGVTVKYRNNSAENIGFLSTTHDFADIRSFEIEKGRYFSLFESKSGKNRAVLGAVLAEKLFENANPIGKVITVRGKKLIVSGVLKKEGVGGLGDDGFDEVIIVPINLTRNMINLRSESLQPLIMVKAREDVSMAEFNDDLVATMRAIRKLKPDEKDDFALNQASLLTQGMEAIFSGINLGGWIIGGFSILVGGFGIANIMFVSVKERTKIIGIQKALGAKKTFILQEFLYESILLSLVGGVFGLLLVFIGTIVMQMLLDVNIPLTFGNIFMAMFISGTIGVISGYAPAQSASRLDPVEAMGATF
ncbi:MAG: ABC transporter permease [Bacteroidota bacterium]|nr:ABC transporter permease [Bacteroidota bacterium]